MLLVLDVGYTNTVMGIFDGEELIRHWRLTSRKQTADEVGFMVLGLLGSSGISKESIEASVYASVVPSLLDVQEGIDKNI
jgi:type III pantothenate kinase